MSEYGVLQAADAVRFERVLPGPIERVWAYLTESEKRRRWLAAGEMEMRLGGSVELHFRHSELSPAAEPTPERYRGQDGASFRGTVTRFDPPHVLSYTWAGEPGEDSEVTFELTPRGDGVLLVLTHRRLVDRAMLLSVAGGWHVHLDILADVIAGAEPRPFWSAHAAVEAEYESRLPATVTPG